MVGREFENPAREPRADRRRAAELFRFDEPYFASLGRSSALALVNRDVSTLKSLVRKLERLRARPDSKVPKDIKERLYGQVVVLKRGVVKIAGFESRPPGRFAERREFDRREEVLRREREFFDAKVGAILDTGRVAGLAQLAEHAADFVVTTDIDRLRIAGNYFLWLVNASEQHPTSPRVRNQARGVLDILTPALDTDVSMASQVNVVFDAYSRRLEQRRDRRRGR